MNLWEFENRVFPFENIADVLIQCAGISCIAHVLIARACIVNALIASACIVKASLESVCIANGSIARASIEYVSITSAF